MKEIAKQEEGDSKALQSKRNQDKFLREGEFPEEAAVWRLMPEEELKPPCIRKRCEQLWELRETREAHYGGGARETHVQKREASCKGRCAWDLRPLRRCGETTWIDENYPVTAGYPLYSTSFVS